MRRVCGLDTRNRSSDALLGSSGSGANTWAAPAHYRSSLIPVTPSGIRGGVSEIPDRAVFHPAIDDAPTESPAGCCRQGSRRIGIGTGEGPHPHPAGNEDVDRPKPGPVDLEGAGCDGEAPIAGDVGHGLERTTRGCA